MPTQVRMIFQKLFYKIFDKCFDHLLSSYQKILARDVSDDCNDRWVRDCLGLPCVHTIRDAINTHTLLVPDDIHDF